MEFGEINRPGEDVVLDYAFSGTIVCGKLEIRRGGALYGVAEAASVKVAGTFEGAADCDEFVAVPGARGRGAVFAGRYLVKDCEVEYFHSTRRASSLRDRAGIAPSMEQAIERGIAEALATHLPAAAPALQPVPESAQEGDSEPAAGLSDRLAALGVEPAFPEDSSAEETPLAIVPAAHPTATEFPQLV